VTRKSLLVVMLLATLLASTNGASAQPAWQMDKAMHFGGSMFGTGAMMELGVSPPMAALLMMGLGAAKELSDGYWDGKYFTADALGSLAALLLHRYGRVEKRF
jgi:hypothetical protein